MSTEFGRTLLKRLLQPKTIAVVGGVEAHEVVRQCDVLGFDGKIWPVNPKRAEMEGRACFNTLESLPEPPDVAFVAVPRDKTVELVRYLSEIGAGGVVCMASGFAETGEEGVNSQWQLIDAAGEMPIVGPNCYGFLNYLDGAALWPDQQGGERCKQGVAIISQSGNLGMDIAMQQRNVPIGYLISVGNQACLSIADYINVLIEDERINAIGLQFEGLLDIGAFSRAALAALKKKIPIVAIKAGRSELARQTAVSHTSSLTGADNLYDALFDRMGIARVNTLAQFLETLKLLSVTGTLSGNEIATISCSGGEAAMAADLAENYGLKFPPLNDVQRQGLSEALGPRVALANPLDYHTYIWGDKDAQQKCFSAMMLGEQDVTLKIIDFPIEGVCDPTNWYHTVSAFEYAADETGSQGVVVSMLSENLPKDLRQRLCETGIPPMQGLEECLCAIANANFIHEKQQDNSEPVTNFSLAQGDDIVLNEHQAKQAIASYGVSVPKSRVCRAEDVLAAVSEIGFPVVLKALSSQITHKTEAGAVRIDLQTERQVDQALTSMKDLSKYFLVEEMVDKPVAEILVGVARDAQFGLVLVIGAGGVLTELLRDTQTLLFPVQENQIHDALSKLSIYKLLGGFRGQPDGDIEALVAAVLSISRFAESNSDTLLELDINPLMVFEKGQGVKAVDALIRQVET